jgi:hypothetical protein
MANNKRLDVPRWSVRIAVPGDLEFVWDSWMKSAARTYPNNYAQEFAADMRARVQRILDASVIAVAHLVDDENELLGHIVYGKWRKTIAVHYAFVKPDARRHGVFISMLDFANWEKWPVVLTSPAQDEKVMQGLSRRHLYDQRVLPLMQRGDR